MSLVTKALLHIESTFTAMNMTVTLSILFRFAVVYIFTTLRLLMFMNARFHPTPEMLCIFDMITEDVHGPMSFMIHSLHENNNCPRLALFSLKLYG